MFKILCVVGGFFFVALVVFVCHLAYIVYKDKKEILIRFKRKPKRKSLKPKKKQIRFENLI